MADYDTVNGHELPLNGNIDLGSSADIGKIVTACRIFAAAINTSGGVDATVTEGALAVVDSTASCFAAGANGATNPVLLVDAATSSVATGIEVTGAAASGGVAIAAISSTTNEALTLDAKGSGTINIAGTSTGDITLSRDTNLADGKNIELATTTGTQIASATSQKLGFYAATPVVRQTAGTAVVTTSPDQASTNWGFTTSTQAEAIIALVNANRTALANLGLIG